MTAQEIEQYKAICAEVDRLKNVDAENARLRKRLEEEERYQQWCMENRFKGYASGYMTRCVGIYTIEHRLAEEAVKTQTVLRKLANNPAIALDVRQAMDKAVWHIEMYMQYRKNYYELRDTNKNLVRIEFKKKMAKKKAGD